ncbi:HNH endonuclease [Pantoea dispersa]|uniref:HNH endonuclease signature motif containing protein n=1 Tax=Pantoea dispersa TaxID=59814 RepID=UPI0021AE866F|nr:HNH endonuclease signature motif containing protein [Pantoea dispersa]MCT6590821.1 HNH endonuclease [Pantoea dispersa]
MKINFRSITPIRSCKKKYSQYTSFKDHLAKDFNYRCGYTDCPDFWFGGKVNFHIDHFIPWKSHPDKPYLKTDYSNLVYCCSYVNILKSNDEHNYLDPCNIDYNEHFHRDKLGYIIASDKSEKAKYMYDKLKMYMKRYQIIWMLENLFDKIEQLSNAIDNCTNPSEKSELQVATCELIPLALEYKKYLSEAQKQ